MNKELLQRKYGCVIVNDIAQDSGKKYYMVFTKDAQPLFSAYTLTEIENKFLRLERRK